MFKKILHKLLNLTPNDSEKKEKCVKEGVRHSVQKYHKAYKLLEEYDKKALSDPEKLANPERLRDYVRGFQKGACI